MKRHPFFDDPRVQDHPPRARQDDVRMSLQVARKELFLHDLRTGRFKLVAKHQRAFTQIEREVGL